MKGMSYLAGEGRLADAALARKDEDLVLDGREACLDLLDGGVALLH
jgi:hypothetical protein